MAFRVLLTDGASPVGDALYRAFENENFLLVCPQVGAVDWSNADAVMTVVQQSRPAVIVNTLAISNDGIDRANSNAALAEVCKNLDTTVIHLSTFEVFGNHIPSSAYREDSDPQPTTEFGALQLDAERQFAQIPRSIIFRLSWLLDTDEGLLGYLCQSLLHNSQFSITDQWRGSPIFVDDAASAVVALIKQILCGAENWGVFHFHSSDSCSEAELADLVSRLLSKEQKNVAETIVVPLGQRIVNCSGWMEGRRCTDDFGIQLKSWRKGVKAKVLAWLATQGQQETMFASEDSHETEVSEKVDEPEQLTNRG